MTVSKPYTIPIAAICERHGVKYHIYADDTQLYITFDPSIPGDHEHALEKLKKCIQEIRAWMLIHKLKLNDDKTEFIIFQSKYHENRYSTSSLNFQNIIFEPSDSDYGAPCVGIVQIITLSSAPNWTNSKIFNRRCMFQCS